MLHIADHIVVDQIKPERILNKVGDYRMAFAESYKGEGNRADDNFQNFNTSWRRMLPLEVAEIWLEMFRRQVVIAGTGAGFNFCEFWGWPEVCCRDDGTAMVKSRIRILRITEVHQPRPN